MRIGFNQPTTKYAQKVEPREIFFDRSRCRIEATQGNEVLQVVGTMMETPVPEDGARTPS